MNVYYYAIIWYKSQNKPLTYYALAYRYMCKHLPSYPIEALIDLAYDWTLRTFNNGMYYILHRNPSEILNKCKEYGINLDDIKNLQGYIN